MTPRQRFLRMLAEMLVDDALRNDGQAEPHPTPEIPALAKTRKPAKRRSVVRDSPHLPQPQYM